MTPFWQLWELFDEPSDGMKFTLIFDGDLPSGPNKRALYAAKIRNAMHVQLRDLWDNHVLLRQLTHTARVYKQRMGDLALDVSGPELPEYHDVPPPLPAHKIDLCAPIPLKETAWSFVPLIRKSLYLNCAIDILFLRHEEPGRLFEMSGDIDNRLKCFFDGLTMPNIEQVKGGEDPSITPLCCLLEDDRLISDFSVRTGRLLGKTEKGKYDVRIQADVTIKVLRPFPANQHLIGG